MMFLLRTYWAGAKVPARFLPGMQEHIRGTGRAENGSSAFQRGNYKGLLFPARLLCSHPSGIARGANLHARCRDSAFAGPPSIRLYHQHPLHFSCFFHWACKLSDGAGSLVAENRTRRLCQSLSLLVEDRSEEHTSELQSLMRISYAVFCLKKKNNLLIITTTLQI